MGSKGPTARVQMELELADEHRVSTSEVRGRTESALKYVDGVQSAVRLCSRSRTFLFISLLFMILVHPSHARSNSSTLL